MNEDAFFPVDASRRDVLLGGLMAAVATGLPAAAFGQTTRDPDLLSPETSKGTKTMSTITTKDGTEIYYKAPKNANQSSSIMAGH